MATIQFRLDDIRLGRNLHGPFGTTEEAVRSMLED